MIDPNMMPPQGAPPVGGQRQIDPAMFAQLIAQRQAMMGGAPGGGPGGPPGGAPGGGGMNPDILQRIMAMRAAGGGGVPQQMPPQAAANPYMQMLMQRGMGGEGMGMRLPAGMAGPQPQSPQPQGGGWPPRQDGQQRPMGQREGQGPQGAPGVPSPQSGGQGGSSGQQGGFGAYQRMFQGGGQQQQPQQQTPTGLPRLAGMGMPTGDSNPRY